MLEKVRFPKGFTFCAENLEERGVVGHKKLDGVSAFDLWTHRGELEYEAGAKAPR